MKHIFLIGYRGSGKSTVGRDLATGLGWAFVDTDHAIETESGMSISTIFEIESESGFRDREQAVIARLASRSEPTVVALGGGAILREANQRVITATGLAVYLKASPKLLHERIEQDAATALRRPKLTSRGGYEEVVSVLATREPIYSELAEKTVLIGERKPDDIVAEIAGWVKSRVQESS